MKFKEKVVLITGASSGIGKACAEQFAALGANIIITARKKERLEIVAEELRSKYSVNVLALDLDVSDYAKVQTTLSQLDAEWAKIDILINNAGFALTTDKLQDASVENWDAMIDTNVKGLLYMTRQILPAMIQRNLGHIINLGSVAGHFCYPGGNVYSATKYAVHAITQSLRMDLLGTAIRVTEISPGAVETEFSVVRFNDAKKAKEFYQDFTPLNANDIADTIVYAASRPAHVNIAEIMIYPTDQASATLVNRQPKGKSQ